MAASTADLGLRRVGRYYKVDLGIDSEPASAPSAADCPNRKFLNSEIINKRAVALPNAGTVSHDCCTAKPVKAAAIAGAVNLLGI